MSYCIENTEIKIDNKYLKVYNQIINSRTNSCIMIGYYNTNKVVIKLSKNIQQEYENYSIINNHYSLQPFILPVLNKTNIIDIFF